MVENYLGGNMLLWGMAERNFQLKDNMYAPTMQMCFASTNCNVSLFSLCDKDGKVEENYYRRLIDAYDKASKKERSVNITVVSKDKHVQDF